MNDQNGDSEAPGEARPATPGATAGAKPGPPPGSDEHAVALSDVADLRDQLARLKKKERTDLFWAVMGASPAAIVLLVPFLLGDAVLLITMALIAACALQWI